PLSRALVGAPGWTALPAELRAQLAEELNVAGVDVLSAAGGDLVEVTVKPNFRGLGKRVGPRTKAVPPALAAADPGRAAAAGAGGGPRCWTWPASRSPCPPTSWCSPSHRGPAGRWPPKPARRWRWT